MLMIDFRKITGCTVASIPDGHIFTFTRLKTNDVLVAVPDAGTRDLLASTLFACGIAKTKDPELCHPKKPSPKSP